MTSQTDKREILKNDTYFGRAQLGLDLDTPGGRFRSKETITGTEPAVYYPAGPEWTRNGAGVGVDPPPGVQRLTTSTIRSKNASGFVDKLLKLPLPFEEAMAIWK